MICNSINDGLQVIRVLTVVTVHLDDVQWKLHSPSESAFQFIDIQLEYFPLEFICRFHLQNETSFMSTYSTWSLNNQ